MSLEEKPSDTLNDWKQIEESLPSDPNDLSIIKGIHPSEDHVRLVEARRVLSQGPHPLATNLNYPLVSD